MAKVARILPTYSTTRAEHPKVRPEHNRKMRRSRQRHDPIYTSPNVWKRWDKLNDLGLLLRFERIAKRRGKDSRWAEKRMLQFIEQRRKAINEYLAKLKELQEEHEHGTEHDGHDNEQY